MLDLENLSVTINDSLEIIRYLLRVNNKFSNRCDLRRFRLQVTAPSVTDVFSETCDTLAEQNTEKKITYGALQSHLSAVNYVTI